MNFRAQWPSRKYFSRSATVMKGGGGGVVVDDAVEVRGEDRGEVRREGEGIEGNL